jgi:hypothetical protein
MKHRHRNSAGQLDTIKSDEEFSSIGQHKNDPVATLPDFWRYKVGKTIDFLPKLRV